MVFEPSPSYDVATPDQVAQAAFSTPFRGPAALGGLSIPDTFSENAQQGFEDDFGLGAVVKDLTTPAGNTPPDPLLSSVPLAGSIYQGARAAINAFQPQQSSLTPEQYKASPSYRTDIPYDPGMTDSRAAALAAYSDLQKSRAYFSNLEPVQGTIGSLVGQAVDPINYVPILGEATTTALAARFGTGFLARMGTSLATGASEAAINTAAFGALSSDLRAKYGDDTSFQAYVNEIGGAAIIGAAFGAVHGVWGALAARGEGRAAAQASLDALRTDGAPAAVPDEIGASVARQVLDQQNMRSDLTTAQHVTDGLGVMNDAVDGVVNDGEVHLSPGSIATVQRLADEVVDRTAGQRALQQETADVPSAVDDTKLAITPAGTRVQVQPEVVDASQLQAAQGALQVRNRSGFASAAQIEDMAANLDPARLMPNVSADMGAPIVGADNVIDSGNGRVAAIMRASEAYPQKYQAYKNALRQAGYQVPDEGTPILVNRRVTPLGDQARAQFNSEANLPSTARMSAVEIADMDRAALDDNVLGQLRDAPVNSPANKGFVQRFLGNLSQNERNALVDQHGNLNVDGVRRMENALVAKAYGDVDEGVVRKFAEATDDNTRSVVGAMSDVAGRWSMMRAAIRRGDVTPEYDMTPELTRALRLISTWRDQAAREGRAVSTVIREGMGQLDMFSGAISPESKAMIQAFYENDHFARAVGRERIAGRLARMADAAEELGRPQLFEDQMFATKQGIIENAANDGERDLFASDSAVAGAQAVGARGERYSSGADREGNRPAVGEDASARPESGVAGAQTGPIAAANDTGGLGTVDASRGTHDPVPDGLPEATARAERPDTMQDVAKDRGVDLVTGDYAESSDIDQLRQEGALTTEDEATMKAADESYTKAEAFGNALKAAIRCST